MGRNHSRLPLIIWQNLNIIKAHCIFSQTADNCTNIFWSQTKRLRRSKTRCQTAVDGICINRQIQRIITDQLRNLIKDCTNTALVVVGGGISEKQQAIIDSTPHYYYLGEKYGKDVDEIYQIGDVFSTPGHIGLALNQAMFWGIPVVVLNRIHAPEIIYLKNGENGFIVDSEAELKAKILEICNDTELHGRMSTAARHTYETEMQIENMFQGFIDAIRFVGK